FVDVLERSLYNAALDGLSLSGDRFFYGNPLASKGNHYRREWYGTACCPANIARLIASLGNYIYSYDEESVWVNLFIGSNTTVPVQKGKFGLNLTTGYPWNGETNIQVNETPRGSVNLKIRIPGWMKEPAPGGLYSYTDVRTDKPEILLNNKPVSYKIENGYAVISRTWKAGDRVTINTPMQVRVIRSRPELKQNNDRVALQYGPMVYCVEAADNRETAWNFIVDEQPAFRVNYEKDLLGGVNTIVFDASVLEPSSSNNSISIVKKPVKAIPYFSWNNRGAQEMQVWLPTSIKTILVNP
ncbi:MAG TPA: glycoside hydrolase family 127 protein, partial [Chitinophagaceae bacterium]|nr:glycoside hydrolase family 127 protein [Chitinophagaceae bacterium]